MGSRLRRLVAAALALALVWCGIAPAGAQSSDETGIIQISVTDQAAGKALADVRVFLLGPNVASALTNRSGIVKYTDVASGLYRVRVSRTGYRASTSAQFEVLGNKEVDVSFVMAPTAAATGTATASDESTNGLTTIGRTQARVTVSTHDVDADSAIRRISDSLTDALNTLAGVDVTTASNDPDAAQTISLHGHDESQTEVTLDGIPLSAPGTAVNLRNFDTDVFTGASTSFGPSAGALGGSVNFTTLQPTQTWQFRGSGAVGSFDKYNWSLGATGSIGNLGIAALTTRRGGNNPLTFQNYLDQSGQTYPHGGESTSAADFLKLRYQIGSDLTVTLTGLDNNTGIATLCTQWTGVLPCGIGPNNTSTGKTQFAYGTLQGLAGQVALQATGYISSQFNLSNEINRTIDNCVGAAVPCPFAEPYSTDTTTLARGFAMQGTVSQDNQTFTLNLSTYAARTIFTPLVATGSSTLVTASQNTVASQKYQLTDAIKINNDLSLSPNVSVASTTGVGASFLGGIAADWRPNAADDFDLSISLGSSQPAPAIVRSYSDPQSARVNCGGDSAEIMGPGDQPTAQSAADYQASWTHQWQRGNLSVDVFQQTQTGQLVNATITSQAADLPADIYLGVQGYFQQVCPFTPPADLMVYVSQPVNQTTRQYRGYDISGTLALSRDLTLLPTYSTNESFYTAADPQYLVPGSTLILNQQIYGRPMHKGNLTIDAFNPPSKLELLVNGQYVGINNQQHISPYVTFSAGISHPFGIGTLTLFETNIFNTESGFFSVNAGAIPQPLNGGGELITAGNPLPPRTLQLSYAFNTGARTGAGFARRGGGSTIAQSAPAATASAQPRGGLGFGNLKFVAPPAGTDPLALASSRPECTADLQPLAQTVLGQLAAAAKAYAAGQPLTPVTGVDVSAVGPPSGAWYLNLGPAIPPGLFRRPAGAGGAEGPPGGPRGPGFGGPGGPGGEGEPGGPGGFQPQIRVAPSPDQPRPAFTPSPELIAALKPFRALVSCSYGTVWTTTEAQAHGFDVPPPGLPPAPQATPTPAPGVTAAPAARNRGGFIHYAPDPGLFVVRPPDLGTGGGSVKQP